MPISEQSIYNLAAGLRPDARRRTITVVTRLRRRRVPRMRMIPRPETELLVDLGLMLLKKRAQQVTCDLVLADVGTGSGGIAIALACNFKQAQLYATDVSIEALSVASENCRRHQVQDRVHLLAGNLLESVPRQVDMIYSNPPYLEIQDLLFLQPELTWEPLIALDGGLKGTEIIERLLQQSQHKLMPGGSILLELDPWQATETINMASMIFPDSYIWMEKDLSGAERVLVIQTV